MTLDDKLPIADGSFYPTRLASLMDGRIDTVEGDEGSR
jgi:hypothetical protein